MLKEDFYKRKKIRNVGLLNKITKKKEKQMGKSSKLRVK
jgi:hypothetical protein